MSEMVDDVLEVYELCDCHFSGDFFARVIFIFLEYGVAGFFVTIKNWCIALSMEGDAVLVSANNDEHISDKTLGYINHYSQYSGEIRGRLEGSFAIFQRKNGKH